MCAAPSNQTQRRAQQRSDEQAPSKHARITTKQQTTNNITTKGTRHRKRGYLVEHGRQVGNAVWIGGRRVAFKPTLHGTGDRGRRHLVPNRAPPPDTLWERGRGCELTRQRNLQSRKIPFLARSPLLRPRPPTPDSYRRRVSRGSVRRVAATVANACLYVKGSHCHRYRLDPQQSSLMGGRPCGAGGGVGEEGG